MQAEGWIEASQIQLQQVLDGVSQCVFMLDMKFQVEQANARLAKYLGYRREKLLEKTPWDWIVPTSAHDFMQELLNLPAGVQQNAELCIKTATGKTECVQVQICRVEDNTPRRHWLICFYPAEKTQPAAAVPQAGGAASETQAENLRRAHQELSQLLKLKDEFLAGLSHELRAPLNTILGLSEGLLEERHGKLTLHQRRHVGEIEQNGKYLLSVIEEVMDLSKLQSGRLKAEIEAVNIEQLCQNCLRVSEPVIRQKQLQLQYQRDPGADNLLADERRLRQILINLLHNAAKSSPTGSQIGLKIYPGADAKELCFEVWDSGAGFSDSELAYLFQPLIALGEARESIGLSLAMARQLAELHHGRVEVQSQPGIGSRFIVTLPWLKPSLPALPASETAPPAFEEHTNPPDGMPRLILAEDNDTSAEIIITYLEAKGYWVRRARDGQEAVDLARAVTPDLILMDIQMPRKDGLQATREIRADKVLEKLPIIALTAMVMPGDYEQCMQAGATAYLSKPVKLKKLLEVVYEYCKPAEAG